MHLHQTVHEIEMYASEVGLSYVLVCLGQFWFVVVSALIITSVSFLPPFPKKCQ